MIKLADIARRYQDEFEQRHHDQIRPHQRKALDQIIRCHTPMAGEILYYCDHCHQETTFYPSCGHRHCPACQHQTGANWLAAQQQKLLPVDYYMVTFTLPCQLRPFARTHQKWAYQAMFEAASQTLKSFFKRDRQLGDIPGLIGILHTHSRAMLYHPHTHWIVPAGGLDKTRTQWRKRTGNYLFNEENLAAVFRGKFISLMVKDHYYLPPTTPKSWVADCKRVGCGSEALTYLARYLYRGVVSENNILSLHDDQVTFRYKDSNTGLFNTITEHAADFLWRVLQHVLPKGFRRVRNYGFMHGNAKCLLARLQLLLKVLLPPLPISREKTVCCQQCGREMDLCFMRIGRHILFGDTM